MTENTTGGIYREKKKKMLNSNSSYCFTQLSLTNLPTLRDGRLLFFGFSPIYLSLREPLFLLRNCVAGLKTQHCKQDFISGTLSHRATEPTVQRQQLHLVGVCAQHWSSMERALCHSQLMPKPRNYIACYQIPCNRVSSIH